MQLSVSDVAFEQALLGKAAETEQGSTVSVWLSYISLKKSEFLSNTSTNSEELATESDKLWAYYDRAVEKIPRSYKIWAEYCETRSSFVAQFLFEHDESVQRANGTFERAVLNLWTCPRLWIEYLAFIGKQKRMGLLRKVMNRALQSLPITQHDRLWECFLPIVRQNHAVATAADAYKRFVQLHPEHIEDACEFFVEEKSPKHAAFFITMLLNNPNFTSLNNRNKYYWWSELAAMIAADPTIDNAEEMLRNGCADFVVETGRMWVLIGERYARLGRFADAIQTFEDAMKVMKSAKDFAIVFEGATQLLMSLSQASPGSFGVCEKKLLDLLDRRELLLNSAQLRSNPNNVECWLRRAALFMDRTHEYVPKKRQSLWESLAEMTEQHGQLMIFAEAMDTVDPKKACEGKFCDLWIGLSMLVDLPSVVLDAATADEDMLASDIVGIYRYYGEMLLKNRDDLAARDILHRAVDDRRTHNTIGSPELWNLALDVEWCYGGAASTKALFEKCLSTKSATERHVVAYSHFLEQSEHYDEMFRVYERGIAAIGWPNCFRLWIRYLHKFVQTYKNTKRERTRDLFEESLKDAPPTEAVSLFLLYAKFEEDYGIFEKAMRIYKRAFEITGSDDILNVWVTSASRLFGVTRSRSVYEHAISTHQGAELINWCTRYSTLETKLMEFDRARAILSHAAQAADPEKFPEFWSHFETFELTHGTKETYTQMLSLKNIASARFAQSHVTFEPSRTNAPATEDQELADVEAARQVMIQEQQIPETIFDVDKFHTRK